MSADPPIGTTVPVLTSTAPRTAMLPQDMTVTVATPPCA